MLYTFNGKEPRVGKDTYVSETAQVIGDVVIGNNCYIGHGAIVRGDYGRIVIGDGTAVEEGVIIHCPPGELHSIGSKVTFGHGAIAHSKSIGDLAVIGMGAITSVRSVIGAGAIVAEGCVVKMEQVISPGVVVAGNPARVVRKVNEKDRKFWDWGKQLYIDLARQYLESPMKPVQEKISIQKGHAQ